MMRNLVPSHYSQQFLSPVPSLNARCLHSGDKDRFINLCTEMYDTPPHVTGPFDHPELSTPEGFVNSAEAALEKSSQLVKEIAQLSDRPTIEIVNKMDELSDTLCRVADLAECIRQVHPDSRMTEKAQEACMAIGSYVEKLNTNTSLHRALRNLIESSEFESFEEDTRRTIETLMHDFEISGIHLEASARERVVKLNDQILELTYQFSRNAVQSVAIETQGSPSYLLDHFPHDSKAVEIDHIPFSNPNSNLRALSYLIYYSINHTQKKVLEQLLTLRHELATLVGYQTFAHRVLKSSMAENPETVMEFLEKLSGKILPIAQQEVAEMVCYKQQLDNPTTGAQTDVNVLSPWDISILTAEAQRRCLPVDTSEIRHWFPLEACLNGLGQLFQFLFGIRIEHASEKSGELWDPHVQKLAFIQENEGLLGYVYADLYSRHNKHVADCHFTIQGGREILSSDPNTPSEYQLPIIALLCNFELPAGDGPCLLSQHSVENLFHEMGHALHSILGRARYQNITGTRCTTDFAEVPSILMEYFLNDSRILSSFARHHQTGEPLPKRLVKGFQLTNHFFPAHEMQTQILYAVLDQKFHTEVNKYISEEPIVSLHEKYSPTPYVEGTAWYLRFNHLCSYAAKYYSYLWSRAVASLIWNSCFKDDPFSRASGERYREMLRHGGGVHPKTLVKEMLGFEPTVDNLVDTLYSEVLRKSSEQALFR